MRSSLQILVLSLLVLFPNESEAFHNVLSHGFSYRNNAQGPGTLSQLHVEGSMRPKQPSAAMPNPETSFRGETPKAQEQARSPSPLPRTSRAYGGLLGLVIIVALAGSFERTSSGGDASLMNSFSVDTVANVLDATIPSTSTDLVAVALGEALAGIIGSVLSVFLRRIVVSTASTARNKQQRLTPKPRVADALADGDYFLAQAGLFPSLELAGLPPAAARLGSTILAAVPSQLIKISSKRREILKEEALSMEAYLKEEQEKLTRLQRKQQLDPWEQLQDNWRSIRSVKPSTSSPSTWSISTGSLNADLSKLEEVTSNEIDFVEMFTDIVRWLEYNFLMAEYVTQISWDGVVLDPGISGALFGALSALSTRLYADSLYRFFRCGPSAKQAEVRTRSVVDWLTYYTSTLLSAATLFGVYEYSQRPISRWIQGILAGGFDACLGSDSFEACFDIYIAANAPGPSPEAQARAFASNLLMVGQRLEDIAGDTSWEDIQRLVRAWAVSVYSYLHLTGF